MAYKKRFFKNNQLIFDLHFGQTGIEYNANGYGNLEHGIKMFVDGAKLANELISNYLWIFHENETTLPFYTSDNPVVRLNHHRPGFIGIEYIFPINSKLLLSIVDKEVFDLFKVFHNRIYPTKNIDEVMTYNEAQIHSCYRQVFSSLDNFNVFNGIKVKDDNGCEKTINF